MVPTRWVAKKFPCLSESFGCLWARTVFGAFCPCWVLDVWPNRRAQWVGGWLSLAKLKAWSIAANHYAIPDR